MEGGFWFHRNPFKSSAPVSFLYPGITINPEAQRICVSLRGRRSSLIGRFSDAGVTEEELTVTFNEYVSLLIGFLNDPAEATRDGKLRFVQKFNYTESVLNTTLMQQDVQYELACTVFNMAAAMSKMAARRGNSASVSMEDAKLIHANLKMAAGYFTLVKEELIPRLITHPERGSDLDPAALTAYVTQARAEAQEVTISRAIDLKHDSGLIAGLSQQTAELFKQADESLSKVKLESFTKWRLYLQIKEKFYKAYAYSFHSDSLLASDKCGEAIRVLQEAQKCHVEAGSLCDSLQRSARSRVSESHVFNRLGRKIVSSLEKCSRENGFIYFQSVPSDCPELQLNAAFGLVDSPCLSLPTPNALWSVEAYAGFDITHKQNAEQKEQEVKIIKEPDLKASKDGLCSIS